MPEDLLDIVEEEVLNNNPPEDIKEKLLNKGFLEEEIDHAIQKKREELNASEVKEEKRLEKLLVKKEVSDRIGYGFVPHQFINVLFYLIGANYLWLGLVNGLKSIFSILASSMFQEMSKVKNVSKNLIAVSGYVFGFSFLGMAVATLAQMEWLFAVFLLIGGIGVVTHGDLYDEFVEKHVKMERVGRFLAKIGSYGVIITGVSMLISGYIMEYFPMDGSKTVEFLGNTYPVFGYLISFEITAIAFILSGYFISKVKEEHEAEEKTPHFFKQYFHKVRIYLGTFFRNKYLFMLFLTTSIAGAIQVLGNSYFGVFIYDQFTNVGLGGFLNVAVVFFIAIMFSLVGPWFSKFMRKKTGLAPTLVFGSLLTALMPLALVYNPNLYAIGGAAALSVVGASILGVSQGLVARKLLREDERKAYFSLSGVIGIIPMVIIVPLGSYLAQVQGLDALFQVLAAGLAFIVAPLFIALVFMGRKRKL